MKKSIYISSIFLLGLFLVSCDHSENDLVPEFLDGTQYGVILHVDVSSATTINIADIATSNIDFEISIEGDKRPVASVTVNKIFVGADGGSSAEMQQTSVSSFPSTVSLSVNDLVNGIPGLSTDSLAAGDGFQIKFTITYADGGVVTRFGTRLNPNFDVKFE
jgi:hypothetical protein